ncbi:MAG: serine/threonine-protein kinase, partial [Actinoplanes sp.]
MSDDWPISGTLLATRYRLVELLETGGMAEIWRADDELLGRPVAVKLPTGPQVAWREARLAARLSHPGIAAVHDYREAVRADGTVAPFVVMELLAGETVAARLVRDPIGLPEAARIGAAVADALAAAHANGVVHRDVKPGNVMLTPNGVKILDFGISAPAGEPDDDDTGATFGTPAYVAPERLDGMPAEPATDVYGLGVLLFEMVTGDPPYPVDTWEELAEAKASGPGELPPELPADFRSLVGRCLDDDPANRPGAEEIRYDLTALWLTAHAEQTGTGPAAAPADEEPAWPVSPPSGEPTFFTGPQPTITPRANGAQPAVAAPSRDKRASTGPAPAGEKPASGRSGGVAGQGGPGGDAGRSFASGRAPAATLQLTPAPKRRVAVSVLVIALVAAVGGIFAAINWPRSTNQATPEPPAQTVFSMPPTPSELPVTTAPPT